MRREASKALVTSLANSASEVGNVVSFLAVWTQLIVVEDGWRQTSIDGDGYQWMATVIDVSRSEKALPPLEAFYVLHCKPNHPFAII